MAMSDLKERLEEILANPAPAPIQPSIIVPVKAKKSSKITLTGLLIVASIIALAVGVSYSYLLREKKIVGHAQTPTWKQDAKIVVPVQAQPTLAQLKAEITDLNAKLDKHRAYSKTLFGRLGVANNENVYIDQNRKSPKEKLMFTKNFEFMTQPQYAIAPN